MMRPEYRERACKFAIVLALTATCTLVGYAGFGRPHAGVDDADIALVYAKHLAQGHGFVYNIGDERVEGFSCFSWVLLAALFFRLSWEPEALLLFFNVAVVTLALTAVVIFIDDHPELSLLRRHRRPLPSLGGLVFLAWVLAVPGYVCWTTLPLMETGLWSALLISTAVVILRSVAAADLRGKDRVALSLLMPLVVLTRPEGIVWALFFVCLTLIVAFLKSSSLGTSMRHVVAPLVGCFATVAAMTLFRVGYFGYLLPNTYYAKMSPDVAYNLRNGLDYFLEFVLSNVFLPLHLLAIAWGIVAMGGLLVRRKASTGPASLRTAHFVVSAIVLLGIGVPIYMGGDHFGSFRFYQPLWPLLILPTLYLFARLKERMQTNAAPRRLAGPGYWWVVPVVLLFFLGNDAKWHDLSRTLIVHEFGLAKSGREVGRLMNQLFQEDRRPAVGVVRAGGVKYTYRGRIVDLMGINHVAMGHHQGDRKGRKNHAAFSKEVFYELAPEVVIPRIRAAPQGADPSAEDWGSIRHLHRIRGGRRLKGLLWDDRFLSKYRFAVVRDVEVSAAGSLTGWFRKDYLDELISRGPYDVIVLDDSLGPTAGEEGLPQSG